MRWIFISAHLDDAILSCGALIWQKACLGIPVEIWTIFAGNPPDGPLSSFAEMLHKQCGLGGNAVAERRDEDVKACSIVKAKYWHMPIPDSIYRISPHGKWFYNQDNILGKVHPDDTKTVNIIKSFLAKNINQDDVVICPLAVGNHVDHKLARIAVEAFGGTVLYYADLPYALKNPWELRKITFRMRTNFYPISEMGLHIWQEGIAAYPSQESYFFKSITKMQNKLTYFWQKEKGIFLYEK